MTFNTRSLVLSACNSKNPCPLINSPSVEPLLAVVLLPLIEPSNYAINICVHLISIVARQLDDNFLIECLMSFL